MDIQLTLLESNSTAYMSALYRHPRETKQYFKLNKIVQMLLYCNENVPYFDLHLDYYYSNYRVNYK